MLNASSERSENCALTTTFIQENRAKVIRIFEQGLQKAQQLNLLSSTKSPKQLANYLFVLHNGLVATIKTGATEQTVLNSLEIGLQILD